MPMSECKRIRNLIGGYLYDELPEVEHSRFESHLQHCRTCRDEVEAAHSLIRRIPTDPEEMPAEAQQRVLRAVQDRLAAQARGPRLRPLGRRVLIAAAAAAMVVWVAFRLPHGQDIRPARHPSEIASSQAAPALQAPRIGRQAKRPQDAPLPAPMLEPSSPRPDERTTATRTTPEHAPPLPARVARAQTPVLLAPRPVGVDDVTTTLKPLEMK